MRRAMACGEREHGGEARRETTSAVKRGGETRRDDERDEEWRSTVRGVSVVRGACASLCVCVCVPQSVMA